MCLLHDFLYEEVNPFYQLLDEVTRIRELLTEARQRAEKRLSKRLETGVAVKKQVIDLELSIDSCLHILDEKKNTRRIKITNNHTSRCSISSLITTHKRQLPTMRLIDQ